MATHKVENLNDTVGACGADLTNEISTAVWWNTTCRECIKSDNRPLIVTPGFYEKYHRPGDNMLRGRYT